MLNVSVHEAADHKRDKSVDPNSDVPVLTVIVPVFNEADTIAEQLARILDAPYAKQVIVVDDGSTDGTPATLRAWQDEAQIEFFRHDVNRGAGAAIRTALPHARGQFTIIQDADLGYDPQDYPRLIGPLLAGESRAVFGSRYMSDVPPVPIWKRPVIVARAVWSRARSTTNSIIQRVAKFPSWSATRILNALPRPRAIEGEFSPTNTLVPSAHPVEAANSLRSPEKHRSPRWSPRRFGAAVFRLTARTLYGTPISDVTASLKALSTDLLRKLDLQCERFEFGPEVAAKLRRSGEKIIEVPVKYEHRLTRLSWIIERFVRRPAATDSHAPSQKSDAKKHRWSDGLHALDTLWRWRHWVPQTPDPDRIPAVDSVDLAANRATVREVIPAAIEADIEHWAGEDSRRSAFDEAAWSATSQQHATKSTADRSVEVESTMSTQDAQPLTSAAVAAAFDARLMWEKLVRKPSPKFADDYDDTDGSPDWEHWALTDLLLLLAIVNIGLVLMVTLAPSLSSWSGLLLAVLASAVTFRTTRAGKFKVDKCNHAFVILAILLVCSIFPSSSLWRSRAMLGLAALALLAGLFRLRLNGFGRPERNLLDAVGVLALLFAGLDVASFDRRAIELLLLLASVTLFLGVHQGRVMRRPSDNSLLVGAAMCIFLVVVFSYLFPVDLWRLPWWDSWLRFRYRVLPHWTELWWFRWGIVTALAAVVGALLMYRARRRQA